jgi:hypothetical protein
MNTHPVRIAMVVKANNNLIDHLPTMCKILELMSEREFKNRRDVNEVLSLKYHMLYYIVKDMKKQKEKDDSSDEPKKIPFIDRWIKSMILGRDVDGYPVFQVVFPVSILIFFDIFRFRCRYLSMIFIEQPHCLHKQPP